jgi:hypothetical protein
LDSNLLLAFSSVFVQSLNLCCIGWCFERTLGVSDKDLAGDHSHPGTIEASYSSYRGICALP